MKSVIFFAIIYLVVIPLIALGCDRPADATTTGPALNGGQETQIIDITLDKFDANKNLTQDIVLVKPGSLIVRLGSNASTGFEWAEALINDTAIVTQAERNFIAPTGSAVGSAGTDVWTFNSLKAGTANIKFSYGRSWDGGEKDVYTLTINVTVK